MNTYKVTSDNFTYGAKGATVAENELAGLDLAMLIQAGHLEPINAKSSKKETQTEVEGE